MAGYVAVPAVDMFKMLVLSGFTAVECQPGREVVYRRTLVARGGALGSLVVSVYTSVSQGASYARKRAGDAIRVTLHWEDDTGRSKGLGSERVFRVGTVTGVLDRTLTRMREAWVAARKFGACSTCGAATWPENKRCVLPVCKATVTHFDSHPRRIEGASAIASAALTLKRNFEPPNAPTPNPALKDAPGGHRAPHAANRFAAQDVFVSRCPEHGTRLDCGRCLACDRQILDDEPTPLVAQGRA